MKDHNYDLISPNKVQNFITMTLRDADLILKKILVGALLVVIPLLILWGGLQLTIKVLTPKHKTESTVLNHSK